MRLTVVLLSLVLILGQGVVAQGDRVARIQMPGLGGGTVTPFDPRGAASVTFFVATDCPVSNAYAPVIRRVCREYGSKGISCSLIYEDVDTHAAPDRLDQLVLAHVDEYGHRGIPVAIDRDRRAATAAKATITPQAVVTDRAGTIRYRGRIDNLYAALGKTRQQVTSHDLRDALEALLAGRPVPNPETQAIGCFIVDPSVVRKHDHE
jgi:hypothetical protein